MRAPRLAAWLVICIGVVDAHAEDWDHDANIEDAVGAFVTVYGQAGMAGTERLVSRCYGTIDGAGDTDVQLRRLETCASMDLAAWRVDRTKAPAEGREPTAYFSTESVMGRVQLLSNFVTAPGVEDQVLRAWSKAVADALAKAGF
jgi:hypothetical protein